MGVGDNLMLKLDEAVTGFLGDWDAYTTTIAAALVLFVTYKAASAREPDAHPMLLARQAQASPVRQPGYSAVYRSNAAFHGQPLSSGLGVKDPGDSKWSRGRDGDLRDVWRRTINGPSELDGKEAGIPGKTGELMTILGAEQIIKHSFADITRQINIIGKSIKENGGKRVAIYLPNSVEFLATFFACAFYDLVVILIPYDQESESVISMLKQSKADTVVAAAGTLSFDVIREGYPALKQLIWVVDEGNKHMDWNEVPSGTGGDVVVSTYQDLVQDSEPESGAELPAVDRKEKPQNLIAFWPTGEMSEFTQANLVAGIAGQLSSMPSIQRITQSDLFLPADSFSTVYPLVLTLTALFSNASVALNSVAGRSPNLALVAQGIAPTIVLATESALSEAQVETTARLGSPLYSFVHWSQTKSMAQGGHMPVAGRLSRMFDSQKPVIGTTPEKLRLIFVSKQVDSESKSLTAETLSDIRIYTGARTIYALTAPQVAGAVSQTGIYDYRLDGAKGQQSHFGVPVTSVEMYFKDTENYKTTDTTSSGEIIIRGPAVIGGEANLGVNGRTRSDNTLILL